MNLLILECVVYKWVIDHSRKLFLGYHETSSTNSKLLIHISHQTFWLFKISSKTLVTKVCNNWGDIENSTELIDVRNRSNSNGPNLNNCRADHDIGILQVDGKTCLWVFGGFQKYEDPDETGPEPFLDSIEVYYPPCEKTRKVSKLNVDHKCCTILEMAWKSGLNGRLHQILGLHPKK